MANYGIRLKFRRLLSFVAYFLFLATIAILLPLTVHNPVIGQTDGIEIVAEFLAEHPPGNIAIFGTLREVKTKLRLS